MEYFFSIHKTKSATDGHSDGKSVRESIPVSVRNFLPLSNENTVSLSTELDDEGDPLSQMMPNPQHG